jgi:hypothetical protein
MQMNPEESAQLERFQTLASLDRSELEKLYDADIEIWLRSFINVQLPGHGSPSPLSPDTFVDLLHNLRDNKRAWSQTLGDLILRLADTSSDEERQDAMRKLEDFIRDCPWTFLQESAIKRRSKPTGSNLAT